MKKRALVVLGLCVLVTGCELFTFADDSRRKGLLQYEQGAYTDAAGSFQNATKQRPTDYQSFYYLGQSYEKLNQLQRALVAYKSARDTAYETPQGIQDTATRDKVYDGIARTAAKSTDRETEIAYLQKRATTARNGDDYIVLARLYKEAGDPDSAISSYSTAVNKYPREQWYAQEYANYLISLGLKDRAKTVLNNSLKYKPNTEITKTLSGL